MAIMEWGVLGIGVVIMLLLSKIGKRKPVQGSGGIVWGPPPIRISTVSVLFGLVKLSIVFAIFIGTTMPLISNPPEFLVEWWYAIFFADLAVFIFAMHLCFPKSYLSYMDRKSKNVHTSLDWLVGAVLSIVLFGGVGVHLAIIGNAPGFTL